METVYAGFVDEKHEKLIREFRAKAGTKFQNKQGAIKKALLEAIGNWVKTN